MAKKRSKRRNPVARVVRTPEFRPRIVEDKTKYSRKEKHKHRRHDAYGGVF